MKTINAKLKSNRHAILSLVLLTVVFAAASCFATQSVTLAWLPSSSPDVTGYKIYYRTSGGEVTNVVTVGATTNAAVSGLIEGATYLFSVTACDDSSNLESDPSNEIAYTVPETATLAIEVARENGVALSVSVTATGTVSGPWVLESSPDLQNWTPALQGTNAPVNFSMPVTGLPAQYFRLKTE